MPEVNACWCGAAGRESFSSHYDRCQGCGTLVSSHSFDPEDYTTSEGENVFYGSHYWREYVPDVLGLPGLNERARSDLGERAVYYLERVLQYVEPGSKVVELGCAPGSFAFLMDQAGFRVTGVELGEEIVDFVRRRFGIKVLPGPFERAALDDEFDAVVMIDVLEHLPRPKATLEACAEHLGDNGALMIQTPCYRDEGLDWPMLLPAEHLFLYTEESATELLSSAGFHVIEVSESLFPYDMWMVASVDGDLEHRRDPLEGVEPLARTVLELHDRSRVAGEHLARMVEECATKDRLIERLTEELGAARDNDERKDAAIAEQSGEIEELRADQSSKESLIANLSQEIGELRADQSSKESLIADLSREIEGLRADQSAKESLIREISEELAAVRADQNAKAELIERLSRELEAARTAETQGAAS